MVTNYHELDLDGFVKTILSLSFFQHLLSCTLYFQAIKIFLLGIFIYWKNIPLFTRTLNICCQLMHMLLPHVCCHLMYMLSPHVYVVTSCICCYLMYVVTSCICCHLMYMLSPQVYVVTSCICCHLMHLLSPHVYVVT